MKRKGWRLGVLVLVLGLPVSLAAQQSLGDLARHLREQREKFAKKPVKVYTNDNLPARPPGEAPTAAAGMSAETGPANASTEASKQPSSAQSGEGQGTEKAGASEDKKKTKEYWQGRFKALRAQLARAQEQQQLVEDELNLVQIQLARALDSNEQADLNARVKAKQAEGDEKRAATDKVKKALADLEQEFQDSGAPGEWSKTD